MGGSWCVFVGGRRRSGTLANPGCSSSSSSSASRCVPGASVTCAGPGNCTGYQVCKSDGSGLEACNCGIGGFHALGGRTWSPSASPMSYAGAGGLYAVGGTAFDDVWASGAAGLAAAHRPDVSGAGQFRVPGQGRRPLARPRSALVES